MLNTAIVLIFGGIILTLLFAGLLFTLYSLNKKQLEAEKERIALQEKLRNSIAETEQREREQLAALIHDNFSAKLALLHLQIQQQSNTLQTTVYQHLTEQLETIQKESKDLTQQLHPFHDFNTTLSEAIQSRLHMIEKTHPCHFNIQMDEKSLEQLNSNSKNQLYFIIQEAIHNIIKHSENGQANISVLQQEDNLHIEIEHRGTLRPEANKVTSGIGLNIIKKRVQLLQGTFHFELNPFGSILQIVIPYILLLKNEAV
ncbi:MAG: hypothetical protein ORN56_06130 [Chitinophagales bacterium]|jgi:signal transduction histidine kinase|nr:hypothetical protein [Chitinophagales bacterium]